MCVRPGLLDIVRSNMDNGEQEKGVCHLAMEPYRLIQRQPSNPGSDAFQDISAHGQQYQGRIYGQGECRSSRYPD